MGVCLIGKLSVLLMGSKGEIVVGGILILRQDVIGCAGGRLRRNYLRNRGRFRVGVGDEAEDVFEAAVAFFAGEEEQGRWFGQFGEAGFAFFGQFNPAMGEGESFDAIDDLEEGAEFVGGQVGAGPEFDQAKLELVFGEAKEGRRRGCLRRLRSVRIHGAWRGGGGEVFVAGGLVFDDAMAGVEAAEAAFADGKFQLFEGATAHGGVVIEFLAPGDEKVDGFGG